MTELYLIRHAEAEGNLYRIAQGQANSNLTDRGWRQVRALERRFADIPIDAVYASDLYRTCATASAVYKPKGLPLHRSRQLREIHMGVWEHKTWGEIYRDWPEQVGYFGRRPDLWHLEGAEDPRTARDRVLTEIRRIAAENRGKTVAIFTHGYVLRLVLSCLQGESLEQMGKTHTGDNTAVSLLREEDGRLRVMFRDDNSHLLTPEFLAGEKPDRRANGLEPGLWCAPPRLPEQKNQLREWLSGEGQLIPERRTETGPDRETLVGYLQEEPVGLLEVEPDSGWISQLYIRPDFRGRGFGGQLIGQAIQKTRSAGKGCLAAAAPKEVRAASFFRDYGFRPAGADRVEKDIAFLPEFLGEEAENGERDA